MNSMSPIGNQWGGANPFHHSPIKKFNNIDSNGDGKVAQSEANVYTTFKDVNLKATQVMNNKDADGDRYLSAEEFGIDEESFKYFDINSDGKVGKVELNIAIGNYTQAEKTDKLIDSKDTNDDGELSVEELGVSLEEFNRLDKNGDGQVGIAEFNNTFLNNYIIAQNPIESNDNSGDDLSESDGDVDTNVDVVDSAETNNEVDTNVDVTA